MTDVSWNDICEKKEMMMKKKVELEDFNENGPTGLEISGDEGEVDIILFSTITG